MKVKAILSVFLGFLCGFFGYFALFLLDVDRPVLIAAVSGVLFALLLFLALVIYGNKTDKRYAKHEKEITSPVFYRANGNFNLGNGKVRNSNIYFCEDGIALISLDGKPLIMEEIHRNCINKIQCDDMHFNIYTSNGKLYIITMTDAKEVFQRLIEKDWIIQI